MKKIVALVLSLVMVLGLATTAFGATAANYYSADLATAEGNTATYTYTLEKYTDGVAAAKTFDTYVIWQVEKATGAKTLALSGQTYVIAASATSADKAFVDGTSITYLANATTYTAGTMTKLPTVDVADAAKCGDMFVKDDAAAYVDENGKFYVEKAGGTVYNVGGKYVELVVSNYDNGAAPWAYTVKQWAAKPTMGADTLAMIGHDYAADSEFVAGETEVTKVYCKECKASFAFVDGTLADAIAKFGAGNFAPWNGLYVSLTAGVDAPAADATDKVESAETFDAGIAMYVGMSVMAAAGSAVVLKKKD